MSFRIFGCGRFRFLSNEAIDRALTAHEQRFLDRHRDVCAQCRLVEDNQAMALNMLRATALHAEPADTFDRRVLRRVRLQNVRERFSYWSPAAIGATVAMGLVLAILQIISTPTNLPVRAHPAGEARRTVSTPMIPDLSPETPLK